MPTSLPHPAPHRHRTARMSPCFPFLHTALVSVLAAQLALPTDLLSQMASQPATTSNSMLSASPSKPASNQPLTSDEKILQVLNRFTYGPRPGDVERVRAMGLNAWFNEQIEPREDR